VAGKPASSHLQGRARATSKNPVRENPVARRCNPVIREFAQRLIQAGKPFKVTMVACMRKLLTILNAPLKNDTLWEDKLKPKTEITCTA
jgi:transposase